MKETILENSMRNPYSLHDMVINNIEITDNNISMSGAWYFITDLMRGYTTQKMIYEWDWQDFILDNVQFCVIYIGLALIGLLIARRYCTLTITDYAVFMVSIIIALTVQVVA